MKILIFALMMWYPIEVHGEASFCKEWDAESKKLLRMTARMQLVPVTIDRFGIFPQTLCIRVKDGKLQTGRGNRLATYHPETFSLSYGTERRVIEIFQHPPKEEWRSGESFRPFYGRGGKARTKFSYNEGKLCFFPEFLERRQCFNASDLLRKRRKIFLVNLPKAPNVHLDIFAIPEKFSGKCECLL